MYHFNLPGIVVWLTHLILGVYFLFIGYTLLNKKSIGQINSLILIVLGILMFLYHGHIWLTSGSHKKDDKNNHNH